MKSITNSTEVPLTELLPPSKTSLLRNLGHSFVLHQIKTEHFKQYFIDRCLFNFFFQYLIFVNCNLELCLFLELIKGLFIYLFIYLFIVLP